MTAKVLPAKYQAACHECGVGVDSESEGSVIRWAVTHNLKHGEPEAREQA